jgi:S1-C subfamily serine protease
VSRISPVRIVELLVVAVLGGALALGAAALFGKLGSHTTIQQISPLPQTNSVGNVNLQPTTSGSALTAEQIYKQDAPAVVQITATSTTPGQTAESLGSGFVVDKVGHIITNYHVVQGASKVQVSFSSRDQLTARVVGQDPSTDTAVLKVDAHSRALTPLPLGNSDLVTVGDPVYAIGNPFGFVRTLTTGVVSALQRTIEAPNTLGIEHAIQTDAAINHGNSGGPLIDSQGRAIGVTSQISTGATGQQGNVGIGFAIPINTVRNVAAQIIKTGKVEHAFLGVSTVAVTHQLAQLFKLPVEEGLLVQTVEKNSPADKAGIKVGKSTVVVGGASYLIGSDIIVGFEGKKITTYEQLRDAISQLKPGDKAKVDVYRGDSKKTITVTLGQAPK